MRKALILSFLVVYCLLGAQKVRQQAVAGQFYPEDSKELAQMVDGFLAQATVPQIKDLVAIVSPHAGYVFSGPVAAYSYALLKGRKYDRVVVIAPSHHEFFEFASVYDGTAYATPLGQIPVDLAFAQSLAKASPLIKLSSHGHEPAPEHSLEVQLPFLQRTIGQFKLVPIIIGDQRYEVCQAVGQAVAKLIQSPGTLIVASSDLSHYNPYDVAVNFDRRTLNMIEQYDYMGLTRNVSREWEPCGRGPIIAAMIAAERLGATRAKLLKYANSGDTSAGDRSRVVGYGAVAISKDESALTPAQKTELLKIARKSVETAVKEHKLWDYSGSPFEILMQERGAFVTLKEKGELRGCIGYGEARKALCLTVRDVAAFAAIRDSRFPPVSESELPRLDYEISVLSPLHRVQDVKQIQVGVHGLVLRKDGAEGWFLPQVPVEEQWDRTTYLEHLGLKAGLSKGSWKEPGAELYEFTAVVFGEPKAQARSSQ